MHQVFKFTFVALLLMVATATASAQKFGFVNSAEILADLPAMKAAESNLEGLQKQLQKKGQAMVESFQVDYQALQQKAQDGALSPKQQQEEAAKLQKREQEIGNFEQSMMNDLQKKRQELLEPIYKSVNDAIKAVAEENGYQFIFDQQVLLYGQDSQDVSGLVRAKLGL
ncbi:outer membrane protein [Lewinella marina]|uniref:Outer membrane chaperone Skp n=1 Tax=Neolewinella marina TaxID=438751 RepID=A0A2G0CGI7_9BACT|nr:OmpH family outer membrane protein [Neolewinella marina]NJB86445.1 outer membrane protein [Neolewinella marina]PHK99094.1 outer membrane chaperone Skp [Neolewinella marina]